MSPRYPLKKIPLKKPKHTRGGRPSLGKNFVLKPGIKVSGYAEGDGVPESQEKIYPKQHSDSTDFDVHYHSLDKSNRSERIIQDNTSGETKITDVADIDTTVNPRADDNPYNAPHSLERSISQLSHLDNISIEPVNPDCFIAISSPPLIISNPNNAIDTVADVMDPNASNLVRPTDITGIPDPAGFKIETDIQGNRGF